MASRTTQLLCTISRDILGHEEWNTVNKNNSENFNGYDVGKLLKTFGISKDDLYATNYLHSINAIKIIKLPNTPIVVMDYDLYLEYCSIRNIYFGIIFAVKIIEQ